MAGHAPEINIPQLPHLKAVVITAAWHPEICDALVAGAVRGFKAAGIASPVTRTVAGSFELPLAAQLAFDEGFDVGEHGDDLLLHGSGFAADGAAELLVGGPEGKGALRVDEVHDGLGLGEVHFAIEEGPLGEFAGFRRTCTTGEETIQNTLGDEHAAMAVELDDVLARVAGR